jgi:hypothetical protein
MKMTKKRVLCLLILPTLALVILLSLKCGNSNPYNIQTFKSGDGWGYNILIKGKIYIHQEFVPAISGNQKFKSEDDARKIANLVAKKMGKGKLPSIFPKELDSLHIQYKSY